MPGASGGRTGLMLGMPGSRCQMSLKPASCLWASTLSGVALPLLSLTAWHADWCQSGSFQLASEALFWMVLYEPFKVFPVLYDSSDSYSSLCYDSSSCSGSPTPSKKQSLHTKSWNMTTPEPCDGLYKIRALDGTNLPHGAPTFPWMQTLGSPRC